MENCYFCQKSVCARRQSFMFSHLNKNIECLRLQKEYHQRREEEEREEQERREAEDYERHNQKLIFISDSDDE